MQREKDFDAPIKLSDKSMKRQRRIPDSIVKIELEDGYYGYAQILEKSMVYFEMRTKNELRGKLLEALLEVQILFFCSVYNDVITKDRWLKVGKLPIKTEFEVLPMKFIHDDLKLGFFELYDPNTGEITSSIYEKCKDLECAAVWEAEHVEDRLRDHYNGVENKWVKSMSLIKGN